MSLFSMVSAFVMIMFLTGTYPQQFEITSQQSLLNSYVPNEISLQLSHMTIRGQICQKSIVSRIYCLQACMRECADLGNQLTIHKMRCLSGKRTLHSGLMGSQLACRCYFTRRRKVHKAHGRRCITSAYSWYSVQDFFLKNYMKRTDCVPSSRITDLNSPCGRILVSMSNITNINNAYAFAAVPYSQAPLVVTAALVTTVATTPTTQVTTTTTTATIPTTTTPTTTTVTTTTTTMTTPTTTTTVTTPTTTTTMTTPTTTTTMTTPTTTTTVTTPTTTTTMTTPTTTTATTPATTKAAPATTKATVATTTTAAKTTTTEEMVITQQPEG